jgi:hypothetical protein
MSKEDEPSRIEIDEGEITLDELNDAALENASGGLVFTLKLVAAKSVSWS